MARHMLSPLVRQRSSSNSNCHTFLSHYEHAIRMYITLNRALKMKQIHTTATNKNTSC